MTPNKSLLTEYQEIDGGFVAFGGSPKGGKITCKHKIRTGKLDFEDVYFLKELKFNLLSVLQMCDKKNNVLFTETECLVLSPDFKLLDESQVFLKVPRQNNMYSFGLKNVVPSGDLTCLFAKATIDAIHIILYKIKGFFYSGCSRHMTPNKSLLTEYQEIDGGFVAFGGSPKGGKITCKHKIRTGKLDFEDVYFLKELKFNLLSVLQMCDKKNNVLFTETECLVLSPDFKLLDESQVFLKVPRQNNISPNLEFMRPFRCPATILNTLDHLGKFNGKADEGFLVRYSINIKAFRIFKYRTRKVKENMHVNFLKNKQIVAGSGLEWLFNIDSLTKSMNYELVSAENQSNGDAGIQTNIHVGRASQEKATVHECILLPFISSNLPLSLTIQSSDVNAGDQPRDVNAGDQPRDVNAGDQPGDVNVGDIQGDVDEISRNDDVCQGNEIRIYSSTDAVNAASTSINIVGNIIAVDSLNINTADSNHINMPTLEATGIFDGPFDDRDLGAEVDTNNLDSSIVVTPIPTTKLHKDHPKE
nr:ribonuclease H-like domain-containing protein [Tanacetum cinerariifolium]